MDDVPTPRTGPDDDLSRVFQCDAYRSVFDATGALSVVVNAHGLILLANHALLDLIGKSREDVEDQLSLTAITAPTSLRELAFARRASLPVRTGERLEFEIDLQTEDGPVRTRATECRLPDPTLSAISFLDISRDLRLQAELRASETRYRNLAEHAEDLILVTEIDGTVTYANPAALRAVGLERIDPDNANVLRWIPEHHHENLKALYSKRSRGWIDPYIYEIEIVRADGRLLPLEVVTVGIERPGMMPEVLVVARDIEQRRAAEARLRQEESKLRLVVETARAYIAFFDADGRYTLVNHRYGEIVGVVPEELLGKHPSEVFSNELWARIKPRFDQAREGEVVRFEELLHMPGSDESRWYSGTYNPILGVDGLVRGHVAVILDISEQKEAEVTQQERETLEVARKLARTVAHEFRQPLTAMRLIADLFRMSTDEAFISKNLEKIPGLVDRMDKLVIKLLEITSLQSKTYLHDLEILDLSDPGHEDQNDSTSK